MNNDNASRTNSGSAAIDEYGTRMARALAQRTGTRHGFLRLVGKGLLGLVGAPVLAPLLPVDRRVQPTDPACNYWKYCYIYGKPCANCGGSDNSCPSGCSQSSSSWTGCCRNPGNGCWYYVTYYDCCGCGTCSTSFCSNGPTEPAWCSGYTCTLAVTSNSLCVSTCA